MAKQQDKQPNPGATQKGPKPDAKPKEPPADKQPNPGATSGNEGDAPAAPAATENLNKDEREPTKPANDATGSMPGKAAAPAPTPAPAVAADTKPTPPPKSTKRPTIGQALRLFSIEWMGTARWGQVKSVHSDGRVDIMQDGGPMRSGVDVFDVLDDQKRQALVENHGGRYVWAEFRPPE